MTVSPYVKCPEYKSGDFTLRLVKQSDASDLYDCYGDKTAAALMNDDNCAFGFYFDTLEKMRACIDFWLEEYSRGYYVRLAIIDNRTEKAVGTVEIFGGDYGVLRIDLASAYEAPRYVEQLYEIALGEMIYDFGVGTLAVKASNTPGRVSSLVKYGFAPDDDFHPGEGYYSFKNRGMAYCGLACFLCSENGDCSGCKNGGCKNKVSCKNYNCCREKKIDGCQYCPDFPCAGTILDKPRIKAFAEYMKLYGEKQLTRRLIRNKADGVVYHHEGKLTGDYDECSDEAGIFALIDRSIEK